MRIQHLTAKLVVAVALAGVTVGAFAAPVRHHHRHHRHHHHVAHHHQQPVVHHVARR